MLIFGKVNKKGQSQDFVTLLENELLEQIVLDTFSQSAVIFKIILILLCELLGYWAVGLLSY